MLKVNWGEDAAVHINCMYNLPLHKERLAEGDEKMTVNEKLI